MEAYSREGVTVTLFLLWLLSPFGLSYQGQVWTPVQTLPPVHASRSHTREPVQDKFYKISVCETGHKNKANASGKYRGYFQFDIKTWRSVGGKGDPLDHSYQEQLKLAKILHADRGWAPWPQCARKLGYI